MKTRILKFNICNTFDEWVTHFESDREIQAAAGITPLFSGPHEDDTQKVYIVMQTEDDSKLEAFKAENEAAILESRHLLETAESNTYL